MRRGNIGYRFIDRYLGIPALRAAAVLNRRRQIPKEINKIGILASPSLGDTLLTSAAVLDLRQAFPLAELIYFASPGAKAAVRLIPGLDRIIPITLTNPWVTVRNIRRCDLDLLLDFSQWQRITALFCGLSGARYRVGFDSKGQSRHWMYDLTVPHSDRLHEVDNFRGLLRGLGIRATSHPTLSVPGRTPLRERTIVFHPWASGQRASLREWDAKNWVELAKMLAGRNTHFAITGTQAELSRSEDLVSQLRNAGLCAETFLGHDGLISVSHLISGSELVVSVNTGIMHLAALLGTPTVALNGPTASHRWGPVGAKSCSVEPRGGGGFLHFGFEFAGHPTDTMQRIHVDDVFAATQTLRVGPHEAIATA